MHVAEALRQVVASIFGTPNQTPQPPPRHHFIQQQLQPRPVFVVDRNHDHAIGRQQITGQRQAAVEEFQPLRMPPAVVGADVMVVVDPILVAGVVGRINIDDADFAGVGGFEQAQRVEVVAFDNQVARAALGVLAPFSAMTGQHQIGIERGIAFDGAGFPGQAELLLGQMFNQQAAQLAFIQRLQLPEQATHVFVCHVHGSLLSPRRCFVHCLALRQANWRAKRGIVRWR